MLVKWILRIVTIVITYTLMLLEATRAGAIPYVGITDRNTIIGLIRQHINLRNRMHNFLYRGVQHYSCTSFC